MPPLVVDVINGFKADLMRKEAQQMQSMARRWQQVEASLQDRVEVFASRVAQDGLTPSQIQSRQFQLDRYNSLLRQVTRELDKYTDYADGLITTGQRQAAQLGIQAASSAIRAVAGARTAFDILPIDAIENMVGLAGDGSPLRTLLQASYSSGAQGMLDQLIRSTALGVNPQVTAQNMVRLGLSQSLNRMMTVARTEQLRVHRESSRQQYQQSGVVENYRRLATRDSRTCMACLMADGEVYELTETLREHPNGRCTTIPTVTGFAPVAWQKGPDWFMQQDQATQRKMLGNGRYNAWQDGRFNLDQLVQQRSNSIWGDSLQVTPLRDLLSGNVQPYNVRQLGDANLRQDEEDRIELDRYLARQESARQEAQRSSRRNVTIESDGEIAQLHLQHYDMIPDAVKNRVAESGTEVFISNDKTVPNMDRQERFRGVQPRGWPDGMTWDMVPGCYNAVDNVVTAGSGGHNASSLLLHEFGHAVGNLGYDDDRRLIAAHRKYFGRLNPYLQQNGPGAKAGRQELLAESFAQTILDRNAAVRLYGEDTVLFIEDVIFQGRDVEYGRSIVDE